MNDKEEIMKALETLGNNDEFIEKISSVTSKGDFKKVLEDYGIGISDDSAETFIEMLKQDELNGNEIPAEELKDVVGGRWKCDRCKKVFPLWGSLWNNNHWDCMWVGQRRYHWVF